jgi:hypothetical protein
VGRVDASVPGASVDVTRPLRRGPGGDDPSFQRFACSALGATMTSARGLPRRNPVVTRLLRASGVPLAPVSLFGQIGRPQTSHLGYAPVLGCPSCRYGPGEWSSRSDLARQRGFSDA